jgi:hypothetical protein
MTKQASNQTAITVANAEAMLQRFEREHAELIERKVVLADRRRDQAYAAHAGDTAAAKALDDLHKGAVELESRIAGLDDAINEARRRLEQARESESRAADRARAMQLRQALKEFSNHAAGVDAALEVLVESCSGMAQALTAMHRAGSGGFPSDAQLLSLGGRVLLGALSKTPFRRNFETLPPLERNRTMTQVVRQWSDTVERGIRERLGETNEAA